MQIYRKDLVKINKFIQICSNIKNLEELTDYFSLSLQNNIEAEKDGKVTAICVKPGQAVLEEDALVVIE